MRDKYTEILHMQRPTSERLRMSLDNRAKIFTPFSALRGFDISILTKDKDATLMPRITLYDEIKEGLSHTLGRVQRGMTIHLTWFRPVKGTAGLELGEYITESAVIERLDEVRQIVRIHGQEIPFDDILDITNEDDGIMSYD